MYWVIILVAAAAILSPSIGRRNTGLATNKSEPSDAAIRICASHLANVELAVAETGRRSMAVTPHQALGFSDETIMAFPFTPIDGLASSKRGGQGKELQRVVLAAWNSGLEADLQHNGGNLVDDEMSLRHRDVVHKASNIFLDTAATILYLDEVWPLLQDMAGAELSRKRKAERKAERKGEGTTQSHDKINQAIQGKFVKALDKWCNM